MMMQSPVRAMSPRRTAAPRLTHEIIEAARNHTRATAPCRSSPSQICAAGGLKGESGDLSVSCGRGGVWGLEPRAGKRTPEIDEDGVLL